MRNEKRNAKILAWRGIISYSLIAEKFGVSRNVVAGVCWRADWPHESRERSPNSLSRNKCGIGRHGGGKYALRTVHNTF